MNRLQQAVLALYDYDDAADDISVENTLEQGLNILAKLPSIICYAYQSKMHRYNKKSLVIHPVQQKLSIAENILYMLRKDHRFSELEARILDMMLIVHADHGGGNNSTFTNVVISSTGTDIYSSIVGAIGSMKGPRHGGANLKVSSMMKEVIREIGYTDNDVEIKALLYRILNKEFYDCSGLIYGMGHAIYTLSDPRSEVLQGYIEKLAESKHKSNEYEFYQRFERCAKEVIWDVKGIQAAMTSTLAKIEMALGVISSRFPIGVATKYNAGFFCSKLFCLFMFVTYRSEKSMSGQSSWKDKNCTSSLFSIFTCCSKTFILVIR